MTVKTLKEYCRMFGLNVCAPKNTLQSQLEEFSKDQDKWDRLRPGMHRLHKGSRTVTAGSKKKTSHPKLSAQHLAKLRGDKESNAAVHDGHNVVEHSKDLHTPQEISEILPWAQTIITMHTYRPESEVATGQTAPARPGSSGVFLPQWQTESMISSITSESLTAPPSDNESAACEADEMCYLKLGDGTEVSFAVSSIPDPVAVTFMHNISRLNAMWDDTSYYWKGESVLMIEGRPIPIVYWPDVYRYGKCGQWYGTKSRWTDWRSTTSPLQDVISRYRQSTPANFWEEFLVNDREMNFMKIVSELRRQHNTSKDDIVMRAHKEFGNAFDSLFWYRKGDKTYVMTDKSAIARHYQQLKEL
ncbi:hypothetical protein EV702DRAFT_1193492 [Suillus placidus]|uniref:SAP domain-containing protein n=1 Tax=Suillus placidus TaxID=48579 RepID=A0A9P7A2P8_9AGAM|nr:hypothetical protein EV702DRAFT_1193492 [Suillus placidus]